METYDHSNWHGTTGGTPWMQRTLLWLFRFIPTGFFYAVTAVDRYGNESTPVRLKTNDSHPVSIPTRLLDNDGLWLSVPRQQLDADRLIVETLQGGKVRTFMYQEEINISHLPEGCYVLRSCNKKGVTHRLGHFFIKRNKNS